MNIGTHRELTGKLWDIANRLRGPYRPPQYRLVMLPIVVLRRFDCVLEPTKEKVLKEYERLKAQNMPEAAMVKLLSKAAVVSGLPCKRPFFIFSIINILKTENDPGTGRRTGSSPVSTFC